MSEHDNDFREVIDEEDKNADVVEVTGDTTVDPSVADPNNDKKDDYEDICYICRRPEHIAGKMIRIPNKITSVSATTVCKRPLIPWKVLALAVGTMQV